MEAIKPYMNVIKSNYINERSYRLSANSQKLLALFIVIINKIGRKVRPYTYRTNIRELVEILELEKSNSAKEVIDKSFVELSKGGLFQIAQNRFTTWVSDVYFTDKGLVEFTIPEIIESNLINLQKNFVKYAVGFVLKLDSKYSIRIYEILKMHEFRTKSIPKYELAEFRKIIDADNKKYNISMFIKRILEPSFKEINEQSDINCTYKLIKQGKGKAYTHIELAVSKRSKNSLQYNMLNKLKPKEINRKKYDIPVDTKNSMNYEITFKNFVEYSHNYPINYSFEAYLYDNNARIIHLSNGGKDIEFFKNN